MRKLNREQEQQRADISAKLNAAREVYNERVAELNNALADLRAAVERAAESYNEAAQEARDFAADIANQQSEYVCERSEKWTDSDAGNAYSEWQSTWENYSPNDIEPDMPQDMDEHDDTDVCEFDDLPIEPEAA